MQTDFIDPATGTTSEGASTPPSRLVEEPRTVRSDELFGGARVVLIQHADETYRLLITRNNRLILQK